MTFVCYLLLFFFWDRFSLWSSAYSGTHCIVRASLKLKLRFTCPCLQSADIKGLCHHAWPVASSGETWTSIIHPRYDIQKQTKEPFHLSPTQWFTKFTGLQERGWSKGKRKIEKPTQHRCQLTHKNCIPGAPWTMCSQLNHQSITPLPFPPPLQLLQLI